MIYEPHRFPSSRQWHSATLNIVHQSPALSLTWHCANPQPEILIGEDMWHPVTRYQHVFLQFQLGKVLAFVIATPQRCYNSSSCKTIAQAIALCSSENRLPHGIQLDPSDRQRPLCFLSTCYSIPCLPPVLAFSYQQSFIALESQYPYSTSEDVLGYG